VRHCGLRVLAPDQGRERDGQGRVDPQGGGGVQRHRKRRATSPRRRLEGRGVHAGEPQGPHQQAHRVAVGCLPEAALECADGLRAQARPLGQLLLREPGRRPIAFK